jgi:hypothetical protein
MFSSTGPGGASIKPNVAAISARHSHTESGVTASLHLASYIHERQSKGKEADRETRERWRWRGKDTEAVNKANDHQETAKGDVVALRTAQNECNA